MLTVEADPSRVERRLVNGEILCPGCGEGLHPWGWASGRVVRGEDGRRVRLRPRRAYCPACRTSHVLLPVVALLRRADAAEVIGAALVAKALGAGHRAIAAQLDRPAETVRGWLRAFACSAEEICRYFTVVLVGLDPDPRMPAATGGVFSDAVAVIVAVAEAVGRRWPPVAALSPWLIACAATSGGLLHPAGPRSSINTSRLWAGWM